MFVGLFCKSDVIIMELTCHCFFIFASKNTGEPYECRSLLKKSPVFVGLFYKSDVISRELTRHCCLIFPSKICGSPMNVGLFWKRAL